MAKSKVSKSTFTQTVSGVVSLKEIKEVNPDLEIKISIIRDCIVLQSQVFQLTKNQREIKYSLSFENEYQKPMGVRLLVSPDVPDKQVNVMESHSQWVPAKEFAKESTAKVQLILPEKLYLTWLNFCRTYTIKGRVICRRWVWSPIQHRFTICDAPVRGAIVNAYDVDRFLWLYFKDKVGSAFTDVNGNFEIKFKWCCWWWFPWIIDRWQIDPNILKKIKELFAQVQFPFPIPLPDPAPDFNFFQRLVAGINQTNSQMNALSEELSSSNFTSLSEQLVKILPSSPELEKLKIWPWYPLSDCKPDIVFNVTQDCGDGDQTIYSELNSQTRWDIDTVLDGVTLIANENACCGSFCCNDPSDEDCLVFEGVGCDGGGVGYPIDLIEQDTASPLLGFAKPGTEDRPFGGIIQLAAVFGDGSNVDYYKVQRRRIYPSSTGWEDLHEDEVGSFNRFHYRGFPPNKKEVVKLLPVAGEQVLRTISRYREENPDVDTAVDPINSEFLVKWITATSSAPLSGLIDGVYEFRVIGYEYDQTNDQLINQQIMAVCPAPGQDVDPAAHSTFRLRLDNRNAIYSASSVHIDTDEPGCDFPNINAVIINEGNTNQKSVDSCGIARVSEGDTISIYFNASDIDGHLDEYFLTAHWDESDVFNVISAGTLEAQTSSDSLVGPHYNNTFSDPTQMSYRTAHSINRPFWYGGNYKVTVTVGATILGNTHKAFETCCAFLLRLRVWKRTTNGCGRIHLNTCEFSFTIIREDLIGNPAFPSCTELCPPDSSNNINRLTNSVAIK